MISRTQERLIIPLLLLLVVCGAGYLLQIFHLPQAELRKSKLANTPQKRANARTILPKDRSLRSLSGDELQALVDELINESQENPELKIREKKYLVDSDSTVVTGGYESEPGVFVFTTIHFWVSGSPSDPQIAFKLNREKISLSGDYKILAESESEIGSGHGYGHTNGKYRMYFKGIVTPDEKQIEVKMTESEFAHEPVVRITDGRVGDPQP